MFHDFTDPGVLSASHRSAWQIDDVFPESSKFDFSRPLLPESLARTNEVPGLSETERLTLNHIRGHEIHRTVMQTSPNYFNMARPIRINGALKLG